MFNYLQKANSDATRKITVNIGQFRTVLKRGYSHKGIQSVIPLQFFPFPNGFQGEFRQCPLLDKVGLSKIKFNWFCGQNLPQTSLSVFNPKTLSLPATRLKSIRQRKQASDWREIRRKKRGATYRRSGILMLRL